MPWGVHLSQSPGLGQEPSTLQHQFLQAAATVDTVRYGLSRVFQQSEFSIDSVLNGEEDKTTKVGGPREAVVLVAVLVPRMSHDGSISSQVHAETVDEVSRKRMPVRL